MTFGGDTADWIPPLGELRVRYDESVGLVERKRAQQHATHDAEHRSRHADAERERQHHHDVVVGVRTIIRDA